MIHFDCPFCNAHHERGYVNGIDVFRCLKCGYVGYGYHPDPVIDAEVHADVKEALAIDKALGLKDF